MTQKEKIIYLAGIVDGEGHFYKPFTKNGRGEGHLYARIVIVQKEPELIEWIKREFRGSISFQDNDTGGIYRWAIQGKEAIRIAKELQPYLIVKREQVKRIL
uniref:Homing endonuclease LAGLIDADG domain-containing protein n=1 Tax=viral metagenome TaxID=1070528 RepID=A0A6M3JWA6_9ZZZZ